MAAACSVADAVAGNMRRTGPLPGTSTTKESSDGRGVVGIPEAEGGPMVAAVAGRVGPRPGRVGGRVGLFSGGGVTDTEGGAPLAPTAAAELDVVLLSAATEAAASDETVMPACSCCCWIAAWAACCSWLMACAPLEDNTVIHGMSLGGMA